MVFITSHVSGYRKILIVKPQPISEIRDPMIPESSRHHEATKVYTGQNILNTISLHEGSSNDVCLWHEGKPVHSDDEFSGDENVVATLRLRGGKGGFGSMLRAIGAQIEKTTNREACRDLSGRRLRDINEEKRLKEFLSKKVEKEKEMLENKRKKLEQMKDGPKHTFEDKAYFEQREKRENDIYTSLDKAFTKTGEGRTCIKNKKEKPKEKPRKSRMISDLDDSSSDEDSESDEKKNEKKKETDKEIESAEEHKETGEEREGKRKSEEGESGAKRLKSS